MAAESTTILSSFALLMHGARTPPLLTFPGLLPAGAVQMYTQGQVLRRRYLYDGAHANDTSSLANITSANTILGISADALDATQIFAFTNTDQSLEASAQALMQGLFPPVSGVWSAISGGEAGATDVQTGEVVDYPLDGYQYAPIVTSGTDEVEAIYVDGSSQCPVWSLTSMDPLRPDPVLAALNASTFSAYQEYFTSSPLHTMLPPALATSFSAYPVYEYFSYMRRHNASFYAALQGISQDTHGADIESHLAEWAYTQQARLHMATNVSGLVAGDDIRLVAGRTMAYRLLEALRSNIYSHTHTRKLTLGVAGIEPFLGLYKLLGLEAPAFQVLPPNGAMLLFELVAAGARNMTSMYPALKSLRVHVAYRAGTAANEIVTEYGVLGADGWRDMPWTRFVEAMAPVALNSQRWCTLCSSMQYWCYTGEEVSTHDMGARAAAGAIGAAVMLGVVGVFVGIVIFGCGVSVRWNRDGGRRIVSGRRGSFKSRGKVPGDVDRRASQNGGPALELQSGPATVGASTADGINQAQTTRRANPAVDGDDLSIKGRAVEPKEVV